MGRRILAVVVAMITAVAIIWIVEMIGSMFGAHAPKNLEYLKQEEIAAYMQTLPLGGYLTVLFGFILASFAAGWLVTKISKEVHGLTLPLIVGGLLTLGGILNVLWLPGQPVWFMIVSILCYLPFTLIGHRVAQIYLRG